MIKVAYTLHQFGNQNNRKTGHIEIDTDSYHDNKTHEIICQKLNNIAQQKGKEDKCRYTYTYGPTVKTNQFKTVKAEIDQGDTV